jgi:asparagine synthase (glutamine-hydrolysing)
VPLKQWINKELKGMVEEYVASPTSLNKSLVDPSFTRKLLDNKIKMPSEKRAKILYTLLSMEIWYKKVYLN